jgi:hypothetical protein
MGAHIDERAVIAELSSAVMGRLDKRDQTEAAQLLVELVADWAREANSDGDPQSVLVVQRKDLDAALHGKTGPELLGCLRVEVAQRKINRLSAASWALGSGLIDGRITQQAAHDQGLALMADTDAVLRELDNISDAEANKRLRRDLNEVRMEALYAVERKAMSLRLNRYLQDKASPR